MLHILNKMKLFQLLRYFASVLLKNARFYARLYIAIYLGIPLITWPLAHFSQNVSAWLIAPIVLVMSFLLVVVPSTIAAVKETWKKTVK